MPVLYQGKMIAGNSTGGVSDIQTKLEGSPGQVVGFDASGNATAIQGWSNPNLLVNWDFRNPINSQGKTTYPDGVSGPAIDSWYCIRYGTGVTGNVSINNGYMTINCTAGNENAFVDVRQTLDLSCIKSNTSYTFSVLTQSGLYTITLPANGQYIEKLFDTNTILFIEKGQNGTGWNCIFRVLVGGAHNMIAAKLEEGTVQTLAHKVGDTWILNDVAPCLPIEMLRMGYRWCNPNLLDNWYFLNPVNQRLKTTYTENSGYIIDRWKLGISNASNAKYDVTNHKLSCDLTNSGYVTMSQTIDHPELFANNTLTFSVLSSSASRVIIQLWRRRGESVIAIAASKTWSNDVFTTITFQYSDILPTDTVMCIIETQDHFDVVAAKLELGPVQTLAHQENGVWVLNEIPDYGEELRKCQRYYFKTSDSQMESISAVALDSTTLFCWARFPTTMRANVNTVFSNVIARNAETGETITGLTTVSSGPNGIAKLSKSGAFTAGKFYQLSYEASVDL